MISNSLAVTFACPSKSESINVSACSCAIIISFGFETEKQPLIS